MSIIETNDFQLEIVEINKAKMDDSNVLVGCWGDSGSDWANNC